MFPNRGNIKLFYGNGQFGLEEYAPFKGIIISASISYLKPLQNLIRQLSGYGGRLIVPVGDRREQLMYIIEKKNKMVKTFILKGIIFQFVRMVLKTSLKEVNWFWIKLNYKVFHPDAPQFGHLDSVSWINTDVQ